MGLVCVYHAFNWDKTVYTLPARFNSPSTAILPAAPRPRRSFRRPPKLCSSTPIKKLTLSVDFINPLLLYSTKSGIDPSNIQNGINGFSFWEGGATPNTRGVGFNVNLGF